jgi:hypothetical protein
MTREVFAKRHHLSQVVICALVVLAEVREIQRVQGVARELEEA